MATSIPSEVKASTDACLVCLEKAEHLKVVGLCRHAFCEPCLNKHLQDAKEVFLCPSCQSECPIPSDGIAGLEDLVSLGDTSSVDVTTTTSEDIQHSADDAQVAPQNCSVCDTLKATSNRAMSFCDKCDMFFCEECGGGHRKNTATKGHVLRAVGAATYDSSGICTHHGRRLKMFCKPCSLPCCGLCVHSTGKHHDHDVCSVGDMIVVAASELGQVLKSANDFVDLLGIQESGTFSAKIAKLDWKETVTRAVEEKAEQCINNILQQKANLLKIVDVDCNTSSEERYLSDVGRMRGELGARIEEGTRLLVNTAADLNHLKRLNDMKANIEDDLATKKRTVLERPDYRQTRSSYGSVVFHSPHIFKEESNPVSSIGSMVDDPFSHAEKIHNLQLPADMKFTNIREIRCLGKFGYAVVCQSDSEEPHDMMMIFNADGKFARVEDDLPAVYGMDVDAHDRLVLLLSGKSDGMFLLKVYDTSGTNAESSEEFPLPKPLSMAISPQGWCNILCEGPGNTRIITVVDLEGKLQTAPIAYDGIHDHSRIACSGDTIYTMGSSFIGVFKHAAGKITFLKHLQLPYRSTSDITVDFFDSIFVLIRGRVSNWPWSYHRHKSPTEELEEKSLIRVCNGNRIHFQSHKLLIAGTNFVAVYRLRTR